VINGRNRHDEDTVLEKPTYVEAVANAL